jgi:hypothetical protein
LNRLLVHMAAQRTMRAHMGECKRGNAGTGIT